MGMPRRPINKAHLLGSKKCARISCFDAALGDSHPSSYYETLDVPDTADASVIHAAYKRRALATHPDKGGDVAEFQRVLDAFQTLSDGARRELYNRQLLEQGLRPHFGKSQCRRRAETRLHTFNQKLAKLLWRMSPDCRRDTILRRLNKSQRADLEKHLRAEKCQPDESPCSDLEQSKIRDSTGVYRASRAGGFYAKVFFSGLGLQGHVRKEREDAVHDHAGLTKVADHLGQLGLDSSVIGSEQASQLDGVFPAGLVASVQVYFYNRQFLGHRHLQLNFKTLAEGLEA